MNDKDLAVRWWDKASKSNRHDRVMGVLRRIIEAQSFRRNIFLTYAKLYNNSPMLGIGLPVARRPAMPTGTRLAYNVVRACSDTLAAELCEDRPKVTVLTSGGDWDLQQRAKDLEAFLDGITYVSRLFEERTKYILDACIMGTGVLKIFREGSKVVYERTFPWELVVDDQESLYGRPKNYYQRKYVDRSVLRAAFPGKQFDIDRADANKDEWQELGDRGTADQVLVVEAWHLPTSKDAGDGHHSIVIENCTLLDEEWKRTYAPFAVYRRQPPPIGFWGVGVAEELMGLQLEINVLLQKIQRAHHNMGGSHWMVEAGAKVATGTLDNDVGSVIRYTGTMPQAYSPSPINGDTYQHLETLYHKAFALIGIPEASAQGNVPPQFESGEAQRVYADLKSKRFNVAVRADHDMMLEIAKQTIDVCREIAEDDPEFTVRAFSDNHMERVRFLDADMDEESAVLQMFPTNSLAKDPSSRLAQVQMMANAGWLEPPDAKRLLGFPDIQAENNFEMASYNLTMKCISSALREGKFIGPEPFMNLEDSLKRVQLAYLDAKVKGAKEDRLQLLRDWMAQAKDMLLEANPPPQPGPAPAGDMAPPMPGGPQAGPPMPPGIQ